MVIKGSDAKQKTTAPSGEQEQVKITQAPDSSSENAVTDDYRKEQGLIARPTLSHKDIVKGDASNPKDISSTSGNTDGDSQRAVTITETKSVKEDIETQTAAPASLRPSSVETVVPHTFNPSIMIEDRPFTTSSDSIQPSTTVKPNKFRSNHIVVPDYRWSKDQGLVASPSAASLDFTSMSPGPKKLVSGGATASLFAPSGPYSWADQISPRTVVSPVQYAAVPPLQAWQKPLPASDQNLSPDDHAVRAGASSSDATDESPFLPITAYSFSTDSSSPPATPAEHRQEVVTPDNDLADLPPVDVYHEAIVDTANHPPNADVWQYQQYLGPYAAGSSPAQGGIMGPSSLHPWMVDSFVPQQMSQVSGNEMWTNPLSSGYGLTKSRFQFAKQLAKQARAGDLPPQVPQSKTNYRSKFKDRRPKRLQRSTSHC